MTDEGVTVIIPMAGAGARFSAAGYTVPKPLIDVAGRPMIRRVLDNLAPAARRWVLLVREDHRVAAEQALRPLLDTADIQFVTVDRQTEGAACTVLLARRQLDPDEPMMIANSDQLVDFDAAAYVEDCRRRRLDASVLVFRDRERNPKWSFVRLGDSGLVAEAREKVAISDLATVGLYLFRRAGDFVNAAVDMIARNDRTNNEFYVCPSFNYLVGSGGRVGVFEVPAAAMHGLGTPEDLQRYLAAQGAASTPHRAT